MSTPSPFETPAAFDTYQLDGSISPPGRADLKGGGNRKTKVEQKQTKGSKGGYTVVQGDELSGVQYEVVVWAPEHFTLLQAHLTTLNDGRKKKPPRVYKLIDPRLEHNAIREVIVEDIGPLMRQGPGKWSVTVSFAEYAKPAPSGGVPKAPVPKSDLEKKIDAQRQANEALAKELETAQKKS